MGAFFRIAGMTTKTMLAPLTYMLSCLLTLPSLLVLITFFRTMFMESSASKRKPRSVSPVLSSTVITPPSPSFRRMTGMPMREFPTAKERRRGGLAPGVRFFYVLGGFTYTHRSSGLVLAR
jgi:hypothetical protein